MEFLSKVINFVLEILHSLRHLETYLGITKS